MNKTNKGFSTGAILVQFSSKEKNNDECIMHNWFFELDSTELWMKFIQSNIKNLMDAIWLNKKGEQKASK